MKRVYTISFIFMLVMSIGLYMCYHVYGVGYGSPQFSRAFFPTYFVLVPFSLIAYFKYKKDLGDHLPKYKLFMIIFIPVVLIGIFTIVYKFDWSIMFFIPLIEAVFVGISEELVYRGVIFTNVAKEKGLFIGILISAFAFSILHGINFIGGLTISSMFIQLIDTFLAGIFFAGVYNYTKNIVLLVIIHAMWDYVLFTDIPRIFPFVIYSYYVLIILEIIIGISLLIRYKKEDSQSK